MLTNVRPVTVRAFEWLGIAMLAFELVLVSGVDWSDILWIPFMLVLIMSVTRSGSVIARWTFTFYCVLSLIGALYLFLRGLMPPLDVASAAWIMTGAALLQLALLWSPAMSHWIDSKREPELPLGTRPCRAADSHRT